MDRRVETRPPTDQHSSLSSEKPGVAPEMLFRVLDPARAQEILFVGSERDEPVGGIDDGALVEVQVNAVCLVARLPDNPVIGDDVESCAALPVGIDRLEIAIRQTQ